MTTFVWVSYIAIGLVLFGSLLQGEQDEENKITGAGCFASIVVSVFWPLFVLIATGMAITNYEKSNR